VSLLEATALCQEITGNTLPIGRDIKDRPADVRIYITDARRLERQANWRPERGVRQTFSDVYQWLRAEEPRLRPIFT
jgi:CDP-paratose 2-epimerase